MSTAPVQLSISFKGIGLPTPIYNEFSLLLANATNNQSVCTNTTVDSYCTLPQPCASYSNLFQYSSFLMEFSGNSFQSQ